MRMAVVDRARNRATLDEDLDALDLRGGGEGEAEVGRLQVLGRGPGGSHLVVDVVADRRLVEREPRSVGDGRVVDDSRRTQRTLGELTVTCRCRDQGQPRYRDGDDESRRNASAPLGAR